MRSSDENVVVGACGLLERSLIAAYARAEEHPVLDAHVRRVIRRQQLELKCSYSYYVRRLHAWRTRARRAEKPAEQPVTGGLVPAMA
jgi:hypothetical protein